MSRFSVTLHCPNPDCLYADNQIGQPVCDRCQQPLLYRHLWAVGTAATRIPMHTLVNCRYGVVSPQIWLDTQPGLPPEEPPEIPDQALPYLHLHPHRLHLPQLFGICQPPNQQPVFLLENAPINSKGQLLPLLEGVWAAASPVRQLNWLWQMWQLWQPLAAQGMVSSLLVASNLHVEGWRLRLRELIADRPSRQAQMVPVPQLATVAAGQPFDSLPAIGQGMPVLAASLPSSFPNRALENPSLPDLATLWQQWIQDAHPTIRAALQRLCEMIGDQWQQIPAPDPAVLHAQIGEQLNQLLLEQAAQLPLQIETLAATTTGPQRSHNEDACYPTLRDLETPDYLPSVGIICDGIGGHAGGEVASQLASRSLQLQIRPWLAELVAQPEPLPPQIIAEQLVEMVRVANNLIAAQNNLQGREHRQRMATTLMLAVQIPQTVRTIHAQGNTHELYLVHVGDSRAYWLTPHACQLLTVDDDVATREVRAGRSLYSQVCYSPDAAALTQALGTREADSLKITVQRLMLDQSGVLLLCSDGLSDQGFVEQTWESLMLPVLQDKKSLKLAVQEWLALANRHQGHDNASVVLMQCRIGTTLSLFEPIFEPGSEPESRLSTATTQTPAPPPADLTESSKALLYDDETEAPKPPKAAVLPKREAVSPKQKSLDTWIAALGMAALTFVLTALSITMWREIAPGHFAPSQPAPPESTPELPDASGEPSE
ncbi:MAG: serine/threonine-protein phosphatase [Cyanobacteria bacterium RM1_2_2]|nr:serine/threonine-protein phosphatase [Cyanobacteria bacterium RM1_2_2]